MDNADAIVESKAATREQMWELHSLLLTALLEYFERTPADQITAAWMGVARAFLRDNNIVVDAVNARDLQRNLGELRSLGLPFIKDTK